MQNIGSVAQPVRACGSYPQGSGFKSLRCYQQIHGNLNEVAVFYYRDSSTKRDIVLIIKKSILI